MATALHHRTFPAYFNAFPAPRWPTLDRAALRDQVWPLLVASALLLLAVSAAALETLRGPSSGTNPSRPGPAVVQAPDVVLLLSDGTAEAALPATVPLSHDLTAGLSASPVGATDARVLRVALRDTATNAAVTDATLALDASMPGMPELRVTTTPVGNGTYMATLPFGMPGDWQLVLTAASREASGTATITYQVRQGWPSS